MFKFALACVVFLISITVLVAVHSNGPGELGVQKADIDIRHLSSEEMAARFGGYCDNYCETKSETCSSAPGSDCSYVINNNKSCSSCTSDTVVEECNGDWLCIPGFTCTDCIIDDPEDCGENTDGQCWQGVCDDQEPSLGECGSAFKCHTS